MKKHLYDIHLCTLDLDSSFNQSSVATLSTTIDPGKSTNSTRPNSSQQLSDRPKSSSRGDGNHHFNIYQAMRSLPNSSRQNADHLPRIQSNDYSVMDSEEASITGENSLFQPNNPDSINKYMSQVISLEKNENHGLPSRRSSARDQRSRSNSRKPSRPSSPSIPQPRGSLEHLMKDVSRSNNFSIRCNSVTEWEIQPSSVSAITLSFRIRESILFRESLLEKTQELVQKIDEYYWKYCIYRIKSIENQGKMLNTQELVLKRNKLFTLQEEFAVAIAHLRSLSIEIIENIDKLRSLINKEIDLMNNKISIYYKNYNYLCKMIYDVQGFFEFSSLRYWIGFIPNALMIPNKDHQPKERWLTHTTTLFQKFLNLHQEKMKKEKKSHRGGRKSGMQQDRKFIADNLQLVAQMENMPPSSPSMGLHAPSSPDYIRSVGNSPGEIGRSGSPLDFSTLFPKLSPTAHRHQGSAAHARHRALEEWEQLRDYCSYSWTLTNILTNEWPTKKQYMFHEGDDYSSMKGISFTYIQDSVSSSTTDNSSQPSQNSFFWNNPDHNPYVVEAAIGFKEVFPSIFIVPPLPTKLLLKCLRLQQILHEEIEITLNVRKLKEEALQAQTEFLQRSSESLLLSPTQSILEKGEKYDESNDDNPHIKKFELKYRQQSDAQSLFGVESSYLSQQLKTFFRPPEENPDENPDVMPASWISERDSAIRHSYSSASINSKPMKLSLEDDQMPSANPAFVTNLHESKSFYTQYEGDVDGFETAQRVPFFMDSQEREESEMKLNQFTSNLIPPKQYKVFTLENSHSQMRYKIEKRIEQERKIAMKDEITGELIFHPNYYGHEVDDISLPLPRGIRGSFSSSYSGNLLVKKSTSKLLIHTKSVKSFRKLNREFSRLDMKFQHIQATTIQRMIRGYLGRSRVTRLKLYLKWSSSIIQLQALGRGFVSRRKYKKILKERKIRTFFIRKDALKQFRSAIIISQFIRKIVNMKRLKTNEPILFDKLNLRGQVVNRHQTFHKLKNMMDDETKEVLSLSNSPYKSILLRSAQTMTIGDLRSSFLNEPLMEQDELMGGADEYIPGQNLWKDDASSINSGFSQTSKISANEKTFSDYLIETLESRPPTSGTASAGLTPVLTPNPKPAAMQRQATAKRLLPLDEQGDVEKKMDEDSVTSEVSQARSLQPIPIESLYEETVLSQMTIDEAEKVKFQKMQALSLVKRVNLGKQLPDSVRSSRLIPSEENKPFQTKKKKTPLSKSDRAFFVLPGEERGRSVLKDPNQAYIPPVKSKLPLSTSPSPAQGSLINLRASSKDSEGLSFAHSLSLVERLQNKQITRKSMGFEDSWSTHAEKVQSLKQEKEMKEQEKFRSVLTKYF
eukprot:gene12403-13562_t